MKKIHRTKIAQMLFVFAALLSLAAGIRFAVNVSTLEIAIRLGMGAALVAHGLILFAFGWLIGQNPPRFPRLAAGFVFLSLVAFIFDDLGPIDFAVMGFYLLLLILCIRIYMKD
jgi:hypothetical protein